jgi:hypothetical protein
MQAPVSARSRLLPPGKFFLLSQSNDFSSVPLSQTVLLIALGRGCHYSDWTIRLVLMGQSV